LGYKNHLQKALDVFVVKIDWCLTKGKDRKQGVNTKKTDSITLSDTISFVQLKIANYKLLKIIFYV